MPKASLGLVPWAYKHFNKDSFFVGKIIVALHYLWRLGDGSDSASARLNGVQDEYPKEQHYL